MQPGVTYSCGVVVLWGTYFYSHALRLSALYSNRAAMVRRTWCLGQCWGSMPGLEQKRTPVTP